MPNQAADNGPGQNAGQKFVKFSRQSAQRIAKVVRVVEAGDRVQEAVLFDSDVYRAPAKLGTFTGAWATGTYKTVTLTNTTNTVSVYNWTTPAVAEPDSPDCQRYVVFSRAGGTNAAVEIEMHGTCFTCVHTLDRIDVRTLPEYEPDYVQILGHDETGCIRWYDVFTCATSAS